MKFAYTKIATLSFVGLSILSSVTEARSLPVPVNQHPLIAQTNTQTETKNQSETNSQSETNKQSETSSPSETNKQSETSSQADLNLLARVIRRFLQSNAYQTEANIQVSAVSGDTTVQSSARVKTIAQHPKKFRSEITFAQPGEKNKTITTLVVSDGVQVWVYRPDLKQYQVLKYDEFDNVEDNYWLGFANTIYAQIPPDARKYIIQSEASSNEVVQAVGLELKDLQGRSQTIDQQTLYVYDYKDAKEGFTFSAAITPETAALRQVRIFGKAEGMDITITEEILQRAENPRITPSTFKFVPPKGTKKVKTLSIGPL